MTISLLFIQIKDGLAIIENCLNNAFLSDIVAKGYFILFCTGLHLDFSLRQIGKGACKKIYRETI